MHRLHDDTTGVLKRLPETERLFPWPFGRAWLHRSFRRILKGAGLPHSSKDLFHKFRRSSYSFVAQALGIRAATEHAHHSCDLSRIYLDPRMMQQTRQVIDVLPRPRLNINGNGKH